VQPFAVLCCYTAVLYVGLPFKVCQPLDRIVHRQSEVGTNRCVNGSCVKSVRRSLGLGHRSIGPSLTLSLSTGTTIVVTAHCWQMVKLVWCVCRMKIYIRLKEH